ncbi:MAG: type I methionyl aminopeptidase [Elusimicrobia bacterium CG1_02_63_36]|nr:MAG: type I methionyl aminopeptidase [Elusimicrobia bacterium CG1_02_63_36]PIP85059.1 MAG: type I methionyl aminopeptidase [Elusimicrobia bacterium CG22_combo_CG10-13_8_21_14_all_63_91]PJA12511.1 MAG: type I methionyl aminopeptidase [Elusimicrobia bacterium CG_4_10_14_0_2_um_filter_63_34]PJB25267.1 MAG: type I methionyl aminopeptidase [Elusimicrobia bacterium CG_4_9_14_3_um_filter_62_55]
MSIELKGEKELAAMRKAASVVAETHTVLMASVEPGMSTLDLDKIAEKEIKARGAKLAFKGYRGYPATLCVSVNDEVVHGIPSAKRILAEGDIVSLDLGAIVDGFYGDSAVTVGVGRISDEAKRLLKVTEESLFKGIEQMLPGNRIGDIGAAVQRHAEAAGYGVVREFVGHGIGRALHEDPPVPNYGNAGTGMRLQPGMVLAIEPMVNAGTADVKVLKDNWTAVTCDGRLSAHFEHTIAVTEEGPEVLTTRGG